MTSTTLAEQYFAMWNEADADRRAELIAGTWTEDATFVDPSFEATGHDELNKLVGAVQQMSRACPSSASATSTSTTPTCAGPGTSRPKARTPSPAAPTSSS